jgi:transcriptional regulator with XRE-family HTH domain
VANANITVTINAAPAIASIKRRIAHGSLGAEVRTRREALNIGVRELARRIEVSPSYLCDIEIDRRAPALDTLDALLSALGCVDQRERWMALAGHIPQDIANAILSSPERWAEVRALLNGGRS